MKLRFINTMLLAALTVPFFTACETDTDSNPTFHEADGFVLNEPAYAANNVYDLGSESSTVNLTCSQPDYGGIPMAVVYSVDVCFDDEFADDQYTTLTTTYTSTTIAIDAAELNSALKELYTTVYGDEAEVPTDEAVDICIRLNAVISGQTSLGACQSNTIYISVLISATESLAIPSEMYLVGSWDSWAAFHLMPTVYGMEGCFYQTLYFNGDEWGNTFGQFKFGTKDGEYIGTTDERVTLTWDTNATYEENDDANFRILEPGYYTIYIRAKVAGTDYSFEVVVSDAIVVLVSPTSTGAWSATDETYYFTDNGDGTLSATADADGEMRLATVVQDYYWWCTEFTFLEDGSIYYRDVDIASNWADNVGSEYSVTIASGQVITIDFNNGTGSVE